MSKLPLIVGASVRDKLRWARRRLYALLILTPLVAGMTYATLSRMTSYVPAGWRPHAVAGFVVVWILEIALLGLSLSRTVAEIFHLRRPESLTDALPVSPDEHFHAALFVRLARTSLFALVVLALRPLLDGAESGQLSFLFLVVLLSLLVFTMLTALGEMFAALYWIHWERTREARHALFAILLLAPSSALAGLSLLLALYPNLLGAQGRLYSTLGGAALCAALYLSARALHARWRTRDIEHAKRLQAATGRNLFAAATLVRLLRPTRSVAAQLVRDLQLTVRAFSSAVYVSAAIFLLLQLLLATVSLTRGWSPRAYLFPPLTGGEGGFFDATILLSVMATKTVCVLALAASVVLTPILVAHQLPHLWLERSSGAAGADVWQAKLLYTRIISLPAPLAAWAVGSLTGAVPLAYVLPLLAECLWLWWMLSTLTGALAYEMPEQPGLAVVLIIFICTGAGLLSAILWPLGLFAYGSAIEQIRERGAHRARTLLLTEGS